MSEHAQPDQTGAYSPAKDSAEPVRLSAWGLQMSRIHLREPLTEGVTPVNLPDSPEMPETSTPRLQLVGEIARGGMGVILKGRDVDLGRDLAVKVLLETHQGKTELAQRFVEEAQINGQLQHPGIVPVYELGVFPDQRPYFTMKLVKGQTLASLLAARQDVIEDRPRFLGVFAQVCQTLAYAHARGVIHRDLKPSNVMVGAFGEVQVMDWGLAKVLKEGSAEEVNGRRPPAGEVSVIRTARSQDANTPEIGAHTQAGMLLGTPAFMAPEQARGDVDLVDERADVFGLGAILCQILTGQPPFTGKAAEALRKAQTAQLDDAHARLDGCGADAELIALAKRCLAAEPWQRPRHAGQVAEEMTAYQHAVTERLRQAELARAAEEARAVEAQATAAQERQARQAAQARALAERRARRLTLALASSVLLTALLGGGGWLWWRSEHEARRAQVQRDVNAALNEATALRERAKTAPARQATALVAQAREQVQRAGALVESGPADAALTAQVRGLLAELKAEEKDRQLLVALEAARLAQAEISANNRFAPERAVPLFREAFRAYGLAAGEGEAEAVAARLRERPSAVREAVLASMDEWIVLAESPRFKVEEPHLEWLRAVLAAAEPESWSKEVRDAAAEKDAARRRVALEKLAAAADVERLPARALTMLAVRLRSEGAEANAVALLRRTWVRHGGDFWVNHDLGIALATQKPADQAEGVRFLTAAVVLRPDSAGAHNNLGVALQAQGKVKEAIDEYQKSIGLDPKYALAHFNLGIALQDQRKLDEAIDEYQKAIAIDPKDAQAHNNIGIGLEKQGKVDEAIAEYQKAIAIDPKEAKAHFNLGLALQGQRKWDEAIAEYNKALAIDPKLALAHYSLGLALQAQGKVDEAIAEYQKALDIDPKYAKAHFNLGYVLEVQGKRDEAIAEFKKAIDLNPKDAKAHFGLGNVLKAQGKLEEAIDEYQKAINRDTKYAQAHNNLGLALQAQGKLDEAIAQHKKALAIDPKFAPAHGALGQALLKQGRFSAARASTRSCLDLLPPRHPLRPFVSQQLRTCEHWLELEPKLPRILTGEVQPVSAAERLEYAQLCQLKKLHAGAVQLYAKAFAADPKIADDRKAQHRYDAACCAALAGSGQGKDADKLDAKERARWRQQALDWLRDDLAAYGKLLEGGKPEDRTLVQQRLQHWRQDRDLTGIRDKEALDKLPAPEREACLKLWTDVDALLHKAQPKAK
jgi:serine/threonine-protein kinase